MSVTRLYVYDYWKGCMDFLLDEISVRISSRIISIVSVEHIEEQL